MKRKSKKSKEQITKDRLEAGVKISSKESKRITYCNKCGEIESKCKCIIDPRDYFSKEELDSHWLIGK